MDLFGIWYTILHIVIYLDKHILCSFHSAFTAFDEDLISTIMGIVLLHSLFTLTYSLIDK